MKKDRKRVRINAWNIVGNGHNPSLSPEKLFLRLKEDGDVRYFIFKPEKGELQEKGYHFQGYLELNRRLSFNVFKSRYPFSDLQPRRGSRQQALDYVKKERTTVGSIYEGGSPRRDYQVYRRDNPDIPSGYKEQWIHISEEIDKHVYQSLEDVKKDYPYLVIHHSKVIERLINEANPIDVIDQSPLRVIGLFGNSGSGKTVWTQKYLHDHGYTNNQITKKKASNEFNPRLGFNLEDRNRKVLGIEEVRENFPHYNDLIKFIDRSDGLEVKGSMIRNSFELLIVNSLLPPEDVYCRVEIRHKEEVLRRIYEGLSSNKVLKVILDSSKLEEANLNVKNSLQSFGRKYQPKIEEWNKDGRELIKRAKQ